MRGFSMKHTTLIITALLIVLSFEQKTCVARKGKHYRRQNGVTQTPATLMSRPRKKGDHSSNSSEVFNVLDYGAKGDGKEDDTKAFEAAWANACKVEASTILVPSGSVFLVKPMSFSGKNCISNIVFQLEGKIIAPIDSGAWGSGLLQWLEFTNFKGITIRGEGIIDGQGSVWWKNASRTDEPTEEPESVATSSKDSNDNTLQDLMSGKSKKKLPTRKPTALRFYGSSDVIVTGITIQNSQQTHLKFDDCMQVHVFDISVSSPGDSPNTDGIHLQNSKNVLIHSSKLACGDDCVSIQTGCSGIYVHDVICGPGHGISIGSLGKDHTKACVSNITVRDVMIHDTMTGVRIKTWQGGSGSVHGVMFANIQVSQVETPIIIDQYYCDGKKCKNNTSAVRVSAISFQGITGTYTKTPVRFACSDSFPCTDITLSNIKLTAKNENEPFCWQTYGKLLTDTTPPIDCFKSGKNSTYNTC